MAVRLRARGAETRLDGRTPAARAGLRVPARGQGREERQRSRGSEPADAPKMPRARGVRGRLLSRGGGGVQRGGSLRSRGPRAPCAMGYPSIYEPFWCWGSYACLAKAVPRGCPLLMPLAEPGRWLRPKWGGGGQEFSFRLSPRGWLFSGAARGSPRFLGDRRECRAGRYWPGCGEPRRDGQGDYAVARPDAAEGECPGGGVFSAEEAPPRPSPLWCSRPASELGGRAPPSLGQGAEEDVLERWRCPIFMCMEWPGVVRRGWAAGHHGPRGQRGSPGTAEPAAVPAGHAMGLLDDPSCWARGSQQAPAEALEQDGHGDDGRTDGQGCGWRLCGQTAASSWLLGF